MSNLIKTPPVINGELQFCPITLPEDYAEKWNANSTDFVGLTCNGELVSNSLYRIGGMESIRIYQPLSEYLKGRKSDYIMILKYVEDFYEDSITKDPKRKRHLRGKWTIIDKNGVEKYVCNEVIDHPYLRGGVLYSIKNKYFNIETGAFYCEVYDSIESDTYMFLENKYDKDESRRGVWKIHKKNGSYEIIK